MTTDIRTSENTVFKNIITILEPISIAPDPELWQFDICPALAASSGRRCKKSVAKYREQAKCLRPQIALMTEWPQSDEDLHKIKDFLKYSHCSSHQLQVLERFEKWKPSPAAITHSIIDEASLTTDDYDDQSTETSSTTREPSLAMSFDAKDDILTPPSTAPATQPDDILFAAKDKLEPEQLQASQPSPLLANVTSGIDSMKINGSSEQAREETPSEADAIPVERIVGLGLTKLERKGTLRDPAPMFSEIFKHLRKAEQKEGVIYVRESRLQPDLFLIGSTEQPEETLNEAMDCSAKDSMLLHTTIEGTFFAAPRAEKLVHTVLREHKLAVTECERCGGHHGGWFRAPQSMVLETVEIMENFVRLPAYETLDGETWKLSTTAHEKIKRICEFSPAKLKDAIGQAQKASVTNENGEDPQSGQLESAAPNVAKSTSDSDAPEGLGRPMGTKDRKVSGGAVAGKKAKNLARGLGRVKNRVSDGLGQAWKKGVETGKKMHEKSQSKDRNAHDAVAGLFATLAPETRTSETQEKDDENRPGTSWITTTVQQVATFASDFKEGWKLKDDSPEETKTPKDRGGSEEPPEPRRSTRGSTRDSKLKFGDTIA